MKVIMLKGGGGVGQRGKIVEVSDGYALNFLIPRGSAEQATRDKVAKHAAREKLEHEAAERNTAALRALVASASGERVTLKARATEKGGLFKSITADDVAKALLTQ